MKKGIFSKMVAAYTIIVALSFFIIATVLSLWFQNYYFQQRKNQLESNAELIKPYAVDKFVTQDNNVTERDWEKILYILSTSSSADIWITDNNGFINQVSNKNHQQLIGKQVFQRDLDTLRLKQSVEIKGTYENILSTPSHIYIMPVIEDRSFIGSVIMITPLSQLKEPLKNVYRIIWFSALLAIIVSSIIIYHFSEKIILAPLAKINSVAKKISKGEVEKRVEIISNDEIGELAESFNSMADNIEKVENHRREFISNVSHEIRSPITSIKGFIGGILDGVIPKEKENYYLSIAYEEIQRLTRLVNDLLDLSAIEAGQFRLRIEELDINELIRITVIKFETKIKAKGLKVDVCFAEDNLYIAGDRDRLVQVLTNLVDNAIKYVSEGGNIKICTKTKGDKVLVTVFNDGPLISKEDISHIWDRFYKADKSRTAKMSTGLGLPIARNILTQLGEDIWVENREGEGVIFSFTLKRVK